MARSALGMVWLLAVSAGAAIAAAEPVADALLRAYPDHLASVEGSGPEAALVWKDGTRMPLGDGAEKPLDVRI
jgi:hypothetical protein